MKLNIRQIAREAGITVYEGNQDRFLFEGSVIEVFTKFADIVASYEREECAQICLNIANKPSNVILGVAVECAEAIRNKDN